MMDYEKKLSSYIWVNTIYLAKSFPMKTGQCHLAHSVIVADTILCYFHTGLGSRRTRQRQRHMMKYFDISTRANLAGLWSGKPPHLTSVIISATAPAIATVSQPANNGNSPAVTALKKMHKKFFSESEKSIDMPDKYIARAGSVLTRSSSF
jgi:hypothetical protein